jgi:hypothetical protein
MAVCDKKYTAGGSKEPLSRIAALEAHVIYLQERLEFYAGNNDKAIRELKKENEALKEKIKREEN